MAYPTHLLPDPMPPPNSPEYVELARNIAVHTGAAARAPRTIFPEERAKAEARYRRRLDALFKLIEKDLQKATSAADVQRILQGIASSPRFDAMCREAAQQMVSMLAVGQKRCWRAAAAASSNGRAIFEALRREMTNTGLGQAMAQIVSENARLIKTVPLHLAQKFSDLAEEGYVKGLRSDELVARILSDAPHLRRFEAKRIARTETSKASTALIRARAEAMNLDFYIWYTANDGERVRPSHRLMHNVVCRWSDPPDPERMAGEKSYGNYDPGGIFNCRCVPLVVVSLADIPFPCRAHIAGRIVRIDNLAAFRERFITA